MKTPLLLTFFLVAFFEINAQNQKDINSSIKDVTIYREGALVKREGEVVIEKGRSTLFFKGLSSKIDPQNLQVSLSNKEVSIITVSHSLDYLNKKQFSSEINDLTKRQRLLSDSLKLIKSLKSVLSQEREMIIANKAIGGDNGVNISDLQSGATFFRNRLGEIEAEMFKYNQDVIQIQERLIDLSSQISQLNGKKDLPTSTVKVVVSSSKRLEASILLTYLVNDAKWMPNYDVRISEVNLPLDLGYKAKVSQNSDEDWNNVHLTLSTGNPTISNVKPYLDSYYLTPNNYYKKYLPTRTQNPRFSGLVEGVVTDAVTGESMPGVTVQVVGTTIGAISDINGRFSINTPSAGSKLSFSFIGYKMVELPAGSSTLNVALEEDVVALDEVVVIGYGVSGGSDYSYSSSSQPYRKKEVNPIAIQQHQTSTEFVIEIPYTIPSDNQEYDVAMINYEIPAKYNYEAVPKLANEVFLIAQLTDWLDLNLLDGDVNLYYKGVYQGQSFLDMKNAGDSLSFSVGRDKEILIDRKIEKEFTASSLTGTSKRELKSWVINVKSNKSVPINLTIEDQFPISKSDDIKVELIESSGAAINKYSGKLKWQFVLNPGESKRFVIKYQVKYPSDKTVIVE